MPLLLQLVSYVVPFSFLYPAVWPMKATPGMWSRCTYVAPKALWSGFIPQGPSSSTSDPTWSLPPPFGSLSALNPPPSPAAPTSTWTATASWGYCCLSRTRLRARCTASAFRKGPSLLRLSPTWTSVGGLRRSSTSWSATGTRRGRTCSLVRCIFDIFSDTPENCCFFDLCSSYKGLTLDSL